METCNFCSDTSETKAILSEAITSPRAVFTETNVTVNGVSFVNTNTYTVSGPESINLASDSAGGTPSLEVLAGNHEFQTVVNLDNDTAVSIVSGGVLQFDNDLNLNGNTLTKSGPGELQINNVMTSGGGVVNVTGGILSGSGAVGGGLTNSGGTISPGQGGGSASAVPEPGTLMMC